MGPPYHRANRDGGPARRPMGHGSANTFNLSHGSWSTANVRVCESYGSRQRGTSIMVYSPISIERWTPCKRFQTSPPPYSPTPPTQLKNASAISYLSGYEEHRRGGRLKGSKIGPVAHLADRFKAGIGVHLILGKLDDPQRSKSIYLYANTPLTPRPDSPSHYCRSGSGWSSHDT